MLLLIYIGIHILPDPVLDDDGHYQPFDKVYGTVQIQSPLPSDKENHRKSIPFNATQQHVKNVGLLVQCEECEMWRLLFSKRKLSPSSIANLEHLLDDMTYTCGATFDDLDIPDNLKAVCIKSHKCYDPIEKLYYSCGYESICYYCGKIVTADNMEYYPQCSTEPCSKKPLIKRRSRSSKKS